MQRQTQFRKLSVFELKIQAIRHENRCVIHQFQMFYALSLKRHASDSVDVNALGCMPLGQFPVSQSLMHRYVHEYMAHRDLHL